MAGRGKKAPGQKKRGARKSRAEDMTGAKEAGVEVRTAGIGDNNSALALPTPDDLAHHRKTILGYREKVTTAQGLLRNAIKAAKKSGINMESLDLSIKIERQNDPAKAINFFQQLDMALQIGEATIRITPHDTLAGDENELVARRGYEDGKAGRTPNHKYPESSELADLYQKNWMKGQAENLGVELPAETEKVAAE